MTCLEFANDCRLDNTWSKTCILDNVHMSVLWHFEAVEYCGFIRPMYWCDELTLGLSQFPMKFFPCLFITSTTTW